MSMAVCLSVEYSAIIRSRNPVHCADSCNVKTLFFQNWAKGISRVHSPKYSLSGFRKMFNAIRI